MIVYVVTYEHKHGLDVSVYRTEDKAYDAIEAIKAEYPEDFEDDDPRAWCDVTTCKVDS